MRVAFDAAVLGMGHSRARFRTGICRAAESLVSGLAASPECEIIPCATRYRVESADYVAAHPELCPGRSRPSRFRRELYGTLVRCRDRAARAAARYPILPPPALIDPILHRMRPLPEGRALPAAEIYHSPFYPLPAPGERAGRAKYFLTLHDMIPVLYPQYFDADTRDLFRAILRSIVDDAWVLCSSHSTRNDLCNFLRIDPCRAFVTHLAADRRVFHPCDDPLRIRSACRRWGIPDAPYVLSLSTLEPRKNLDHLIRCFARLIQQEKIRDLRLVLVGARGWEYDRIFQELARHAPLRRRIILTGRVPDEDLAPIYSGALAFVSMSLYEGFGLPILEAMQCGLPVIASNASSLPEVVGDAGILLDPRDTEGLCQGILALYRSASRRESMSALSRARATRFSWERCVRETIGAYRAALSSADPNRWLGLGATPETARRRPGALTEAKG